MEAEKISLEYWNSMHKPVTEMDCQVIKDFFHSDVSSKEKGIIAVLLLQSRLRVCSEEDIKTLEHAVNVYNKEFTVEEMFFTESDTVYRTWRYNYKDIVKALPIVYAKEAIKDIYKRLDIELDDEGIMDVYNSDFIYSGLFELVSDSLGSNAYFMADRDVDWNAFAFISYFNMWHLFGPMGFNGYSPYTLCADIGVLTPPASGWKVVALTAAQLEQIAELKKRARGSRYPTWQQNRFMGLLAQL